MTRSSDNFVRRVEDWIVAVCVAEAGSGWRHAPRGPLRAQTADCPATIKTISAIAPSKTNPTPIATRAILHSSEYMTPLQPRPNDFVLSICVIYSKIACGVSPASTGRAPNRIPSTFYFRFYAYSEKVQNALRDRANEIKPNGFCAFESAGRGSVAARRR